MKRALAVLVGLVLALAGSLAAAAWLSTGTGSAGAAATTIDQASAPLATRSADTVSLTWDPSTLANGAPVTAYDVFRHVGAASTLVCTVTSTTCVDTTPAATEVSYGVVARIGTNWRGPESDLTPFTFDDVAPVTTAEVSPAPNGAGWNRTTVTVTLGATDPGTPSSGVDHVSYIVDGGTQVDEPGATADVDVSGVGTHTVAYFATDGVGNAESPQLLTVRIDPSAPTTTMTRSVEPNGSGWNNTDVTLDFSAVDTDASGVESLTVDGVTTAGATASATITAEGITSVSYFATDVADNVEGTKTTTVRIDKTDPTASIDPAGGSSWTTDSTVAITSGDALSGVASVQYAVDGGTLQTYTAPVTLSDGARSFRYVVTDLAGNVTDETASIKVDTVLPTAALQQTGNGQPTITGTDATSGVASVSWRDGSSGGYTTVSGSSTTLSLGNGSHTIWYYATDNAGNASTPTSQTITVNIDTTAPSVDITDPQQGGSYQTGNSGTGSWAKVCSDGRVCATISDSQSGLNASTVSYTLVGTSGARAGQCWTGSAWTAGSGCTASMTLSAGQWRGSTISRNGAQGMNVGAFTLTVRATDNAGNTATDVVAFQTTS